MGEQQVPLEHVADLPRCAGDVLAKEEHPPLLRPLDTGSLSGSEALVKESQAWISGQYKAEESRSIMASSAGVVQAG